MHIVKFLTLLVALIALNGCEIGGGDDDNGGSGNALTFSTLTSFTAGNIVGAIIDGNNDIYFVGPASL